MRIGEKLALLRKKTGLDREEVADKLEVSKSAIGSWETDQREPSFDMLDKLAALYGVTVSDIFSDESQNENKVNLLDKIIKDMVSEGYLSDDKGIKELGDIEKDLLINALDMHIKKLINE